MEGQDLRLPEPQAFEQIAHRRLLEPFPVARVTTLGWWVGGQPQREEAGIADDKRVTLAGLHMTIYADTGTGYPGVDEGTKAVL